MSSFSPFDSKDRVGEQKWYQKITVGYSLQGTNKVNDVPEALLFTNATLTKRFGSMYWPCGPERLGRLPPPKCCRLLLGLRRLL